MKSTLITILFIIPFLGFSQIVVNSTQAPEQLIQNVLLGNGVDASNFTYNGSAVNAQNPQGNVSFFDASNTTFPISSGVLLTTGNGAAAVGPNNSGSHSNNVPATPNVSADPDLNAIANNTVTNGVFLEFDFIPSGDTISFKYIFASEEYPEFSPSSYNDAFGFFLSGPNINGPYQNNAVNLAVIPGTTTPVTINNVNPTTNNSFYVNNGNGAAYGSAIQYDGTTVVLTAGAQVQCGQTYHIKMAICNVGDQGWDSGVFIEASSFGSNVVQVTVATVSGDSTVVEGCSEASFIFTRPASQINDTLVVNYNVFGNAVEGDDYVPLINPIVFLPGQDTVIITFTPIDDGIDEQGEYVTIQVFIVNECGDTIVTEGTIYILDKFKIDSLISTPTTPCFPQGTVAGFVSGTYNTPSYLWTGPNDSLNSSPTITWEDLSTGMYYLTVTDGSCSITDSVFVALIDSPLAIDSLLSTPTSSCTSDGSVNAIVSGVIGTPTYEWIGPGTINPDTVTTISWNNISAGWYYFEVTDGECSVMDSVLVNMNNAPEAIILPSTISGCSPLEVSFLNGSLNATTFTWDFGDGQLVNVSSQATQNFTFTEDALVTLQANQGPCFATAQVQISISTCGCTDPLAINYNPLATVDDGSCFFPVPTIDVPNVFTPNDDNSNDVFTVQVTNATNVQLTILNRWGNVMFEANGINPVPSWDGIDKSGAKAGEGTYFYKYIVTGLQGDTLEGHGFLQLIRN
jgi:gliding motility-associated-like protein